MGHAVLINIFLKKSIGSVSSSTNGREKCTYRERGRERQTEGERDRQRERERERQTETERELLCHANNHTLIKLACQQNSKQCIRSVSSSTNGREKCT